MLTILLAQAGVVIQPSTFDLATLKPAKASCDNPRGSEIVVCARRERDQRIEDLPDLPQGLPPAEVTLGDTKAAIVAEQRGVGGWPRKAIFLRFKMPF